MPILLGDMEARAAEALDDIRRMRALRDDAHRLATLVLNAPTTTEIGPEMRTAAEAVFRHLVGPGSL